MCLEHLGRELSKLSQGITWAELLKIRRAETVAILQTVHGQVDLQLGVLTWEKLAPWFGMTPEALKATVNRELRRIVRNPNDAPSDAPPSRESVLRYYNIRVT